MNEAKNKAIIDVLLERFNNIRFPRILDIKAKVDQGETLNDMDIEFFDEVFNDLKSNQHLADQDEQLQQIVARFVHLNKQIMDKALANEK